MSRDEFIFQSALQSQKEGEPFVRKETVYVLDQNQGNYSGGQVQIDTSAFSNAGKFVDYANAYFEVPLVLRLSANNTAAKTSYFNGLQSSFALGLKNNFANIFHSFSCDLNNTNLIQLTPFSNVYSTFRMLTGWSKDTLTKYGALCGFYPDGSLACRYGSQTTTDPIGHGSVNNFNNVTLLSDAYTYASAITVGNSGFLQRQINNGAFDPTSTYISSLTSTNFTKQVAMSYFYNPDDTSYAKYWFVTAIIRLRDMHPFFEKVIPTRGLFLKFFLNLNTATHNIEITIAGNAITDISCTSQSLTNSTTPLLLANGSSNGNGFYQIAYGYTGANGTYDLQAVISVGKDSSTSQAGNLQAVRLYADLYSFQPVAEAEYLSLNRVKHIIYEDIQQYQVNVSIASGSGDFNSLLSNGVIGLKSLLLIPFFGSSSNYVGATATNGVYPYQSIFATEPSTSSPYIELTQLNVQVSGVNVLTLNEQYDFSQFMDELKSANAINGGLSDGINSGLISYDMWERNYRYYYFDLSRRISGESRVPKSVQITGTVYTGSAINSVQLLAIIGYEREVKIEIANGSLVA